MSFKNMKHSAETKAKISATMKQRYVENPALRNNIEKARAEQEFRRREQKDYYSRLKAIGEVGPEPYPHKPWKHSEETKAKMSAARKRWLAEHPGHLEKLRAMRSENARLNKSIQDLNRDDPFFGAGVADDRKRKGRKKAPQKREQLNFEAQNREDLARAAKKLREFLEEEEWNL